MMMQDVLIPTDERPNRWLISSKKRGGLRSLISSQVYSKWSKLLKG